jgi:hypothetical protein
MDAWLQTHVFAGNVMCITSQTKSGRKCIWHTLLKAESSLCNTAGQIRALATGEGDFRRACCGPVSHVRPPVAGVRLVGVRIVLGDGEAHARSHGHRHVRLYQLRSWYCCLMTNPQSEAWRARVNVYKTLSQGWRCSCTITCMGAPPCRQTDARLAVTVVRNKLEVFEAPSTDL